MEEFRRKLFANFLRQNKGTLASKWYVINSAISDAAGRNTKSYYFAVYLNGNYFYYESDYPFYIMDNGTSYYIVYAYNHTTRASNIAPTPVSYTTGSNLGTKNGIVYYQELYTRTSIIQAKQGIYIWRA